VTLPPVELWFEGGTLAVRGPRTAEPGLPEPVRAACTWDARTACLRAPAVRYAEIVLALRDAGHAFTDRARGYGELDDGLHVRREPRPFQAEALAAWRAGGRRGVVVLPTGAGKTYVAELAIDAVRRDTLIVAPTLNLVAQWHALLSSSLRRRVGVIGGGDYALEPVTVTTYDSAYLHLQALGNRFGLIVFDECHHLPSEAYSLAARSCLAPFRLGLTATPERADGRDGLLDELVGPIVYRRDVTELAGEYLADYSVERILVDLSPDERAAYEQARAIYRAFVVKQGIRMSSRAGWSEFIMRSSLSAEGRAAMRAYQRQKQLAFAAPSKLEYVDELLHLHRRDRVLLFTERNSSAYEMARRFLLPVVTHQTKISERTQILEDFATGTYRALATSKVLNEGVDLPAANVGIVMSGSGSVREHVQRLGRILRKQGDKQAVLYELVAADTAEVFTSSRRREHSAYR
jgi:superfamily II DNA or RNA helicase